MQNEAGKGNGPIQDFLLTDIIGVDVVLNGKRIGKLSDIVVVDRDKVAEVTDIIVTRPFGNHSLIVPWPKVKSMTAKVIVIDLENITKYEAEPPEGSILLKDHILDKKVLDMEDNIVEIVYDLKLMMKNNRLYVTYVDSDKHARLRRVGMRRLAEVMRKRAGETEDVMIPWFYVQSMPTDLSSFKGDVRLKVLKEKLNDLPPVDLADILEELDHDQRLAVFHQLDTEQASDTLEEINPNVQRSLISSLRREKVAELIDLMTPGQAADVLAALPSMDAREIIDLMNEDNAVKIRSILEKQDENILNFTSLNFLAMFPDETAEQARSEYQSIAKSKDVVMYIYVVDENDKLLGVLDIKELLKADEKALLGDVMVKNVISLGLDSTLRDASRIFARYDFRAVPVTDDEGRIVGVVPYRDVMKLTHHFVE
ncbi:MAG: CBS domain-containing protein [Methanomassiliicoccales archaeon]|nr:CBS domain-containing protein [Methanomassiliicoccales archaeon]